MITLKNCEWCSHFDNEECRLGYHPRPCDDWEWSCRCADYSSDPRIVALIEEVEQ